MISLRILVDGEIFRDFPPEVDRMLFTTKVRVVSLSLGIDLALVGHWAARILKWTIDLSVNDEVTITHH